jgi:hypothetical protein
LELGETNKLWYEVDEAKKLVSIRYRDRQVEVALKEFIETALKKINSPLPPIESEIDYNDKERSSQ